MQYSTSPTVDPAPPRRGSRRLIRAALGAATAAALALSGTLVLGTPAADAATTGSALWAPAHNPKGKVGSITATPQGIHVTGWAFDPDAPTRNDSVAAIVDGYKQLSVSTTVVSHILTQIYHIGPTPGFAMTIPVTGRHTVCLIAHNLGVGMSTMLKCFTTPLGTKLASSTVAKHSPTGALTGVTATASSVTATGWATDPDYIAQPVPVALYVDGEPATTVVTGTTTSPRPAGAGSAASYSITTPVSTGTHMVCAWAVNIGLGSNTWLGCQAVDTRGSAPIAAGSPSPAINAKVVAQAEKHIGQSYVWGATGPKTFDCSGLVVYSYKKYGFLTPRTSEQQALAARLIPASDARPGDLVFYHDTQGDVYHVGIYVSPGKTVAAIDTQEGVNWQMIWDPTYATYGSFTHT